MKRTRAVIVVVLLIALLISSCGQSVPAAVGEAAKAVSNMQESIAEGYSLQPLKAFLDKKRPPA